MEIEVKNPSTVQVLAVTEKDIEILKKQYDMFRLLQQRVLEEGIDYGYPAGRKDSSQKPSLYKSGAEKLTRLFNLTPAFELVKAEEREDFVYYMFRCTLRTRDDMIVGEGYGLANSKEKKHWNADPLANANTILKIAKKRSHVDAVLTGLGASNVFTQDLEDYEPEQLGHNQPAQSPSQQSAQQPTQSQSPQSPQQKQNEPASEKQLKKLAVMIRQLAQMSDTNFEEVEKDIKVQFNVEHLNQLTRQQASQAIDHLQNVIDTLAEEAS